MTGISWTDETWNCVRGCSQVSPGCANCYAKHQAARIVRMAKGKPTKYDRLVRIGKRGEPAWTEVVELDAADLAKPLQWTKPRRIFVNSMSDLFHESLTNEQIAAVFGVMAACPQHTFQVLTKRARRMREWFEWVAVQPTYLDTIKTSPRLVCRVAADKVINPDMDGRPLGTEAQPRQWPLPNVHLGVSVENQAAADERIPDLLATPAAVRWLSMEPLLGEVSAHLSCRMIKESGSGSGKGTMCGGRVVEKLHGSWVCADHANEARRVNGLSPSGGGAIDWIVAGCESGPGTRPCDVAWLRSVRDQCAAAGVPFFLKQAKPWDEGHEVVVAMGVGFGPGSRRKPGGVIELPYLDGKQHAAFPEVER